MSKRSIRYNPNRARVPLDATNAGPYIKLAAAVVLIVAFVLFVALFFVPKMVGWLQNGISWEREEPAQAAEATPVPPVTSLMGGAIERLVIDPAFGAGSVADPSVYNGSLLFVTGEDSSAPNRLLRFHPETGETSEIPVTRNHDAIRVPRESGRFLVYFDQNLDGGGSIRVIDKVLQSDTLLCDVRFGVPQLQLEAQYLVFTERTGEAAYRINAVDLYTFESVTVALIEEDAYGASLPSLASGQVLYAAKNAQQPEQSVIESLQIETGDTFTFDPGTFVHDPKSNGDCWAWMTANHSDDAMLYVSVRGGAPQLIARGIANFHILSSAVVYGRDETIYAYAFADGRTYVLSETGVKAQLLTAMNGYVIWRDVSDPGAALIKYLKVM